jgi:hypothetical protein
MYFTAVSSGCDPVVGRDVEAGGPAFDSAERM